MNTNLVTTVLNAVTPIITQMINEDVVPAIRQWVAQQLDRRLNKAAEEQARHDMETRSLISDLRNEVEMLRQRISHLEEMDNHLNAEMDELIEELVQVKIFVGMELVPPRRETHHEEPSLQPPPWRWPDEAPDPLHEEGSAELTFPADQNPAETDQGLPWHKRIVRKIQGED